MLGNRPEKGRVITDMSELRSYLGLDDKNNKDYFLLSLRDELVEKYNTDKQVTYGDYPPFKIPGTTPKDVVGFALKKNTKDYFFDDPSPKTKEELFEDVEDYARGEGIDVEAIENGLSITINGKDYWIFGSVDEETVKVSFWESPFNALDLS